MKPTFKKKWLKALRGGEYEQGSGVLKNIDNESGRCTFCCLGVACDLLDSEAWGTDTDEEGTVRFGVPEGVAVHVSGFDNYSLPSDNVLAEIGLTRDEAETLAALNDGCGVKHPDYKKSGEMARVETYSFPQIADWIEENL